MNESKSHSFDSIVNLCSSKKKEFFENGAVILKNVFSKDWTEKIKNGIEENLENPSPYSESLSDASGGGIYFNDYCNWRKIPDFVDLVHNSPAAAIAATLMGIDEPVFYHEHVLTKDAGTTKDTPWHHDQSYYPLDCDVNLSIWIPIDHVPISSGIRFVSGSHRWGRWFYPRKFATQKNYPLEFKDDFGGKIFEDIPADLDDNDKYKILCWDCSPGDAVIFHMRTLHAAAPNLHLDTKRRVVSLRWVSPQNTYTKRPWTVSPPPQLHPGITIGDSLQKNSLQFPTIKIIS